MTSKHAHRYLLIVLCVALARAAFAIFEAPPVPAPSYAMTLGERLQLINSVCYLKGSVL